MSWIQNFVSAARKYFLFVTPHCTALQGCYQKLTPHCAALQIIYLNRKFLVVMCQYHILSQLPILPIPAFRANTDTINTGI